VGVRQWRCHSQGACSNAHYWPAVLKGRLNASKGYQKQHSLSMSPAKLDLAENTFVMGQNFLNNMPE